MAKQLRQIVENKNWKPENDDESEVLYHVSPHDFTQFRPFSHFGTSYAARTIADQSYDSDFNKHEKTHNYTVRLKMGKVLDANIDLAHHGFEFDHPTAYATVLHREGHIDHRDHTRLQEKLKAEPELVKQYELLANHVRKMGYNTIRYTNHMEDEGSKSYVITHPSQVRILKKTYGPLNLNRLESPKQNKIVREYE